MDLPRRIKLGSLTYTVAATKPAIDAACRDQKSDLFGVTFHGQLRIVLDPSTPEPKQREILLHEALHCVTEKAGVRAELGQDHEEKLVDRIAPLLLDLLRDNATLADYLLAP